MDYMGGKLEPAGGLATLSLVSGANRVLLLWSSCPYASHCASEGVRRNDCEFRTLSFVNAHGIRDSIWV